MIAKFFKKTNTTQDENHPALERLKQMGAHSADCTVVRTADGRETWAEVGPVSFYRRGERLFVRDRSLFLVPPNMPSEKVPFSGHGEVLSLRFHHQRTPYSLNCEVVQRVRFSERLMGGLDPCEPVGFKLNPLSNVNKNDSRGTLRFAHIRGVKGPQVFPHFRFDLFVENLEFDGLAHEHPPEIISFPGDVDVPEAVANCTSSDEMVGFFLNVLRNNPDHLRNAHLSLISRDPRLGMTELVELGYADVLGLAGDQKSGQIHLRNPFVSRRKSKSAFKFSDGDNLLLRFVGRGLLRGSDVYYRWICRVHKCGLETVTLRPKGSIHQQTGLPVAVRDFCVGGIGMQNSPMLESYLLGDHPVPDDSAELLSALKGKGLLLHFYPRMYFPGDVEIYKPRVPAAFSLLGDIVRGTVNAKKDPGRLTSLGVTFRHDPVDFDPQTLAVTAWEPLRGLRESAHFKEVHRALNSLMAYLENK